MMHSRRWVRRGVAGVGLTVPLALAPVLDVMIHSRAPVPPAERMSTTDASVAPASASESSPPSAERRHSRL